MDLLKLRPSDNTAVALRRALDAAEAAQITVAAELDKAQQARDGLLLDGTPADLAKAERTLTAASEMSERVSAMVGQLQTRLAAAERDEAVAVVEAAKAQAEAHSKALGAWWAKQGPVVFAELRRGAELLEAAEQAGGQWQTAMVRAGQAGYGPFEQPANHAGRANLWLQQLADGLVMRDFSDPSEPRPAKVPVPRAA